MSIHNDVKKLLVTEEELNKRIKELAKEVEKDYQGKDLTMICLLKGSVPFFSKLCENIDLPIEYEFLKASSYHGASTTTSGSVYFSNYLTKSIENLDVIIVEDIIDTGLTLTKVKEKLAEMNPKSVKIMTLLDKPSRRKVDMNADYVGFVIPDEFVIGFGLDFDEKYRNLPYIAEYNITEA